MNVGGEIRNLIVTVNLLPTVSSEICISWRRPWTVDVNQKTLDTKKKQFCTKYIYMYYYYVTHTYCMYLNSARTLVIMIQLVRYSLLQIEYIWVFT